MKKSIQIQLALAILLQLGSLTLAYAGLIQKNRAKPGNIEEAHRRIVKPKGTFIRNEKVHGEAEQKSRAAKARGERHERYVQSELNQRGSIPQAEGSASKPTK